MRFGQTHGLAALPSLLLPASPPSALTGFIQEALFMAYEQSRRVVPIITPIAVLSLTFAHCGFGCNSAPDPQHEARSGLERQEAEHCKLTAKIQCPLQCNQIDFDAVCDATLGAGCDAQCDTSATGTCLDGCSADCSLGCKADAETSCSATCENRCEDNCSKVCAGAPRPKECGATCKNECRSMCGDQCTSDADSSCDAKCSSTCNATCSVEAHVACQLRCSVDAWTTCKATVQAKCMADCSTDVMLTCGGEQDGAQGNEAHQGSADPSVPPPLFGARTASSEDTTSPTRAPVRTAEVRDEGKRETSSSVIDAGSESADSESAE